LLAWDETQDQSVHESPELGFDFQLEVAGTLLLVLLGFFAFFVELGDHLFPPDYNQRPVGGVMGVGG